MFTEDILHYCEQLPQTSWPPMIDQPSTTEKKPFKTERQNPCRCGNIGRLM